MPFVPLYYFVLLYQVLVKTRVASLRCVGNNIHEDRPRCNCKVPPRIPRPNQKRVVNAVYATRVLVNRPPAIEAATRRNA